MVNYFETTVLPLSKVIYYISNVIKNRENLRIPLAKTPPHINLIYIQSKLQIFR